MTLESNGVFRMSRTGGANSETIGGLTSSSPFSIVQNYASSGTSMLTVSDNVDRVFAGSLQDGGQGGTLAIVKKGVGAWTLTGSNTYSGTTTVDGSGALFVNSMLGTNVLTLTNNGTLGGSGVISGLVTCARGKLAPGANNAAGTLTLAAGLSVVTSLTNLWQLGALSEATNYDKLVISGGTAALGSAGVVTLDFSLLSADQRPDVVMPDIFWRRNRSWTIVKATGGTISGQFAKISNAMGYAGGKGSFSLAGGNGSDVVLNWQGPPLSTTSILFR